MTVTNTDIGKRLKTIFQHWKKGKPVGGKGMLHFAKSVNSNRSSMERMITGEYNVNPQLLDGLVKLGYSSEWLLHGTGKMREDQKASLGLTEVQMLRAEVDNLRQEIKLRNARMVSVEKELSEIRKVISKFDSEFKNGVNPV